jgi:hypothetical protein
MKEKEMSFSLLQKSEVRSAQAVELKGDEFLLFAAESEGEEGASAVGAAKKTTERRSTSNDSTDRGRCLPDGIYYC